ncbi:MAG: hypothetical protein LBQ22_11685 [Bacteroidales bacterium]|jgi:hypothetical protein|nr:hypothetical protein [Bacteroidales bacterium]
MSAVLNNIKILIISSLILFQVANVLHSQTILIAKFSPVGIHPFNEKNSHIFENKFDSNGIFVTEPCLILGGETLLREDVFSIRYLLGGMSDAASKPAFFIHAGVKYKFVQIWRSSFAIGAGINLYGRERWSTIDGYIAESGWKQNGDWEYKIGPMAELEYLLLLGERHDLTFSILYGHQPRTFSLTIGYRFWLSTEIKNLKGCGSCPFAKKKSKKKTKWHF